MIVWSKMHDHKLHSFMKDLVVEVPFVVPNPIARQARAVMPAKRKPSRPVSHSHSHGVTSKVQVTAL